MELHKLKSKHLLKLIKRFYHLPLFMDIIKEKGLLNTMDFNLLFKFLMKNPNLISFLDTKIINSLPQRLWGRLVKFDLSLFYKRQKPFRCFGIEDDVWIKILDDKFSNIKYIKRISIYLYYTLLIKYRNDFRKVIKIKKKLRTKKEKIKFNTFTVYKEIIPIEFFIYLMLNYKYALRKFRHSKKFKFTKRYRLILAANFPSQFKTYLRNAIKEKENVVIILSEDLRLEQYISKDVIGKITSDEIYFIFRNYLTRLDNEVLIN